MITDNVKCQKQTCDDILFTASTSNQGASKRWCVGSAFRDTESSPSQKSEQKMKSLIAMVFFTAVVTNVIGAGNCPEDWEYYAQDNTCLGIFYEDKKTFQESRDVCRTAEADVVTILDGAKNKFVRKLIPDGKDVWIGITDVQRGRNFTSLDKSALTYQAWDEGQPDNQSGDEKCAIIINVKNTAGVWHDVRCDDVHPVLCQRKETDCNDWVPNAAGNLCFKLLPSSNFNQALGTCSTYDGGVAKIVDKETSEIIRGMLSDGQKAWIDVYEYRTGPGRHFQNIDGTSLTYERWGKIQPNNRKGRQFCVSMDGKGGNKGSWNDVSCDSKRSVVCQKKVQGTTTT